MRWQDDLQFYSMHFMPYVHLPADQEKYDSLWVDFSNTHYDPKKAHELYQRYFREDVFVGSLRTGEIPGTGHLERILFNEKMEELRRESLLRELRQRIRDVRQGPDDLLYLVTDEKQGAVLRIEPAP